MRMKTVSGFCGVERHGALDHPGRVKQKTARAVLNERSLSPFRFWLAEDTVAKVFRPSLRFSRLAGAMPIESRYATDDLLPVMHQKTKNKLEKA
jgi:hypothetical protein